MTLQVFRDGRPDREASRVSNALLKKLQTEDDYAQALKQHFEAEAMRGNDGTYGHMGSVSDPTKSLTAPKAALGGISRAERIARVRARMERNQPPLSLFYDEATSTELLSLEDQEAYEEGWICPNCIQYQGMVSNECNWRFTGERPSDPKYWGCGYRRDLF